MQNESSLGKRIAIGLTVLVALGAIYWFGLRSDPMVDALNEALQKKGSRALRDYPYQFRVLRLEDTLAVMATPRSAAVPVYRMIGALYPALAGKSPDHLDFVAAEQELAKVQSEAKKIVLDQPGVSEAKWELDRDWLIAKGISVN